MQQDIDKLPATSEVWKYATKLSNGRAQCHNCDKQISCKDHNTSGIRRHLYRCMRISKFAPVNSVTFEKSIGNDMRQKLSELVYKCIIEDGRCFGVLRKPGITRLFKGILPGK